MQHEWPTSSITPQLLNIENQRAFSNQFEVATTAGEDTLSKAFSFYATKISLGSYALDVERILSTQRTIIKKASIPETVSLTVKEKDDWSVLKYFWTWYTTSYYDPSNNLFISGIKGKRRTFVIYALASPYKMISAQAAESGNHQSYHFKITINNALLVGPIQLPAFDYQNSNPIEHTFTVQSDTITLEWS